MSDLSERLLSMAQTEPEYDARVGTHTATVEDVGAGIYANGDPYVVVTFGSMEDADGMLFSTQRRYTLPLPHSQPFIKSIFKKFLQIIGAIPPRFKGNLIFKGVEDAESIAESLREELVGRKFALVIRLRDGFPDVSLLKELNGEALNGLDN